MSQMKPPELDKFDDEAASIRRRLLFGEHHEMSVRHRDCRVNGMEPGVIISATTAHILAQAFAAQARGPGLVCVNRAACGMLRDAFDEVAIIERDVSGMPVFEGGDDGVDE